MEGKNKLNNHREILGLIRQNIEKNERQIKKNGRMLEENGRMLEENGKMLEEIKKEIEEYRKMIAEFEEKRIIEFEKAINELTNILQNTKNNNEENGILNGLEEVELNEQFKNKEEIKCVICLENFSIGDKISYLPCIHFFHSPCIKNWARIKNKCPICNNIIKFS